MTFLSTIGLLHQTGSCGQMKPYYFRFRAYRWMFLKSLGPPRDALPTCDHVFLSSTVVFNITCLWLSGSLMCCDNTGDIWVTGTAGSFSHHRSICVLYSSRDLQCLSSSGLPSSIHLCWLAQSSTSWSSPWQSYIWMNSRTPSRLCLYIACMSHVLGPFNVMFD